ncbi:unnamed protein product [Coregonus sp. 'balchen']|nr:unnamed protein product [Coregonus sp. 'balchen']
MIPLFLSLLLAWTPGTGEQQDTLMPFMEYLEADNNDYHATGNGFPLVDEKQSYTILSLIEADGQTTMTFWRSIQSCDEEDFHITDYHATGNGFPLVDEKQSYTILSLIEADGQTTMTFWRSIQSCDEEDFHITVTVPSQHTYYNCKVMKVPKLNGKRHIIRNMDLVHYMLFYSCPLSAIQINKQQCYTGGPGEDCFKLVSVWNMGGGAFELPENAGISIGGQDYDENGTQIDFLAVDDNYNFEMQGAINLGTIKTIKPGDEIVVECTYYTANRKGVTQLGLATTDEMCLAFIVYYPAISVDKCWSEPNMHAYMAMMGETDYQ